MTVHGRSLVSSRAGCFLAAALGLCALAGLVALGVAVPPARATSSSEISRAAAAPRGAAGPDWSVIGRSLRGRPILAARFGSGARHVLIVGGVHGDEAGTAVATKFAA